MDGYGGGGDAGQQQKRCGTTDMAKWVGRTATDQVIIDRERLTTLGRIVAPITQEWGQRRTCTAIWDTFGDCVSNIVI